MGLEKVSLLLADEILDDKGCAALLSLLMMTTAAAKVNAYLHHGTVLSPHCQIHDSILLGLPRQ